MQATFPIIPEQHVTCLILAGGQAKRLQGQDKGLIQLGNQTLVEHTIAKLHNQTHGLIINANRNQSEYQHYGYPVIADSLPDFAGPLAGMLAGLEQMTTDWLLSVPCDNPYLPIDFVATMVDMANRSECLLSVAVPNGQLQPVYCLIHRSLKTSLYDYLSSSLHKVRDWISQQDFCEVPFSDAHAFENINTPEQLAEAEKKL